MNIKTILPSLIVVLVVAAGVAYLYLYPGAGSAPLAPAVKPDTSVVAGPVVAVSASSISVTKQDGTTVELKVTADTKVVMAAEGNQPGTAKKISDVKVGSMVLVTPTTDAMAAQTILLLPAPPAR